MCIILDGTELPLPAGLTLLSDNHISMVWRGNGHIYKRSIPFLIENEYYMLKSLEATGIVPLVSRYDKYTLRLQDLGRSELITNAMDFLSSFRKARKLLEIHGIRHGDLTPAAVIVKNNKVYLIDFAESRLSNDPRPDKRPEGDLHWAVLTAISLLKDSQFRVKI